MIVILSKILIIFLYSAVGFVANKLKVLGSDSLDALNSLVINIATPCLLFSSICGQHINSKTFTNTVIIILISLAMFAAFGFITTKIARRFTNLSTDDQNVLSIAMTTVNSGFMGFPIAKSVFGNTVLYYSIVQNISLNLYLLSVYQLPYTVSCR